MQNLWHISMQSNYHSRITHTFYIHISDLNAPSWSPCVHSPSGSSCVHSPSWSLAIMVARHRGHCSLASWSLFTRHRGRSPSWSLFTRHRGHCSLAIVVTDHSPSWSLAIVVTVPSPSWSPFTRHRGRSSSWSLFTRHRVHRSLAIGVARHRGHCSLASCSLFKRRKTQTLTFFQLFPWIDTTYCYGMVTQYIGRRTERHGVGRSSVIPATRDDRGK